MNFELYQKALEKYGKDNQLTVAIEELSELIKELCKHKRGENNIEHIIEEMADCYIMLAQLELVFNIRFSALSKIVFAKEKRLEERMKANNENTACGC